MITEKAYEKWRRQQIRMSDKLWEERKKYTKNIKKPLKQKSWHYQLRLWPQE